MPIVVQIGDITQIACDAVVNPANSHGFMGGGVAGALKRIGGREIEQEAIAQAPIAIGHAVATTGGSLPCRYVIHAPTMEQPATRIPVVNVQRATKAALDLAVHLNLNSIAIPGMGTGIGGVSPPDAAKAMVDIVKQYDTSFEKILLIDRNNEMICSFKTYL